MYESLYAQNKGLLIVLARHYARACELDRAVSEEDLVQAGFLALVRAKQTEEVSPLHLVRLFLLTILSPRGHLFRPAASGSPPSPQGAMSST